ncbi:PTS fructose transporter subunit IIB [Clostridium vincentii]|uniref:PTS system mannose-specific EIIBCA component n=1 Tax=Clostridium vincentii TaxID=52704 RepID=A0A2T0BAS7_9CLOT|nr:fructose PTS transporter subunit IIB [Clostridium vincentii]PRR80943.1 PTS system mannose-specific EIIBCA component [Clostridium vincentii]
MKIVAITACPAGLAHTPMAAKALSQAGKRLGYEIKVEQQGIMERINGITPEEVQEADFVLVASDQHIDGMERFEGKKVITVKIGVALKQPDTVLTKCVEALEKQK